MGFHNKTSPKIYLFVLIGLFLFTRLYHLLLIPIFTDESIYIYWAKFITTYHSHWFISLSDGKPPLLIWITAFFLEILPEHAYLLAGRLPSVIAGGISLIGMYQLTLLLFRSQKTALLASFLYIVSPFLLFYDRMALFDSLLSAMLIWSVYFSLKTAEKPHIVSACLWGIFLGLGFLSKPTAQIFLMLTPIALLLFTNKIDLKKQWKKIIAYSLLAVVIGESVNSIQRLSHVYFMADIKNQQFQLSIEELFQNPFIPTYNNLHAFFSWITGFYTLPFFILGLISFIILFLKSRKNGVILFMLWLTPIVALATIGREIFPRYVLFTTPYFLIAIAYAIIYGIKQKIVIRTGVFFLFSFVLIPVLMFDYLLLVDPPSAPLPATENGQYISSHASGYGLEKIFSFLNTQLAAGKVTLVTQGTFGLYPYAFYLEYWDNKNLTVLPRWPLQGIDEDVIKAQKHTKVYVLLKEYLTIPQNLPLELILRANKPGGQYPILLTTLKKQ